MSICVISACLYQERVGICMCDTIEMALLYATHMYQTSGKNHFHEMNCDVGMAGWK